MKTVAIFLSTLLALSVLVDSAPVGMPAGPPHGGQHSPQPPQGGASPLPPQQGEPQSESDSHPQPGGVEGEPQGQEASRESLPPSQSKNKNGDWTHEPNERNCTEHPRNPHDDDFTGTPPPPEDPLDEGQGDHEGPQKGEGHTWGPRNGPQGPGHAGPGGSGVPDGPGGARRSGRPGH